MYSELKYTVQLKYTVKLFFYISSCFNFPWKQTDIQDIFDRKKGLCCLMSSGKTNFESMLSLFYFYAVKFLLKYKTQLLNYLK